MNEYSDAIINYLRLKRREMQIDLSERKKQIKKTKKEIKKWASVSIKKETELDDVSKITNKIDLHCMHTKW